MNISAPFIQRPIATTLLAVGLALFGLLAFLLLPVAPLPEVDFPTISVRASLPGADPNTVATSVATPLERQFGQIAGVTQMTSSSNLGSTRINLQFDLSRNIDGAARDVQAAINAARSSLPSDLSGNPTYRKVNPADSPIMIISLTSDSATPGQMYDVASTLLEQKLLQTSGVGDVTVGGGALPAVRIELNPDRLNHYGVSLEQVRGAITASNSNLPKGALAIGNQSYGIGANDMLFKPEDYAPLVVRQNNGDVVHIADLGYVHEDVEDLRNFGLSNGRPAVLLVVFKQPGANVIETVDAVKAALPFLQESIPASIRLNILLDRTTTIRASLHDVEISLLASIFLVTLVTFGFFRDWRSTLVPAIVVPLSLLGTFGAMYFLGYSLNNLSLMALTISTGFVVDDAIVIVENIMRHLERGESRLQAALAGTREVSFTVLSISVSLIAVFIPLLMMGGIVGRLFREFSITLSVAILISMLISLTVTPMLSSVLLRPKQASDAGHDYPDSGFHRFYSRTLGWVVGHPALMGALTVLVIVLAGVLYVLVPKGFFPQEDTGRLQGSIIAPQSISYDAMQAAFSKINQTASHNPNVQTVGGFIGGGGGGGGAINSGQLFIALKPVGERQDRAEQVIAQIRKALGDLPGTRLYLQSAQDITVGGRQSGAQYQYTLTADDQDSLDEWVPKVVAVLHTLAQLTDINTDQQDNSLLANIHINRDTAARLGVNIGNIDQTLYDAFGQRQVSTIYKAANQYHVVMEVAPPYWTDPQTLKSIYVPTGPASSGKNATATPLATVSPTLVPLAALSDTAIQRTAISIAHQGTFPAVTVSFNLAPGVSIGEATALVENAVAQLRMPASVVGQFAGTAQVFQSSVASEPLLIVAALLSVYIVLGILYENLMHPLTILSTLPSAGVGALIALLLTGTELSIIALVGVILLIGIVKKNAIMMIDFAITERVQHGLSAREAIHRACLIRFRPIMMTTLAAILGALPLVLGSGYGSELRRPLGISIIGGLLLSQLLTLYTTPVIYLWLDSASERLRRRSKES
ncbi:efflux RND transporter permease subunit [Pseudomonas gingeri]|uniref:Efflux RND transporter permease subunit n=1 Tax=Pseudomonas gingeri TaxID=117681 RepID=A0A7Y8CJ67_9PSED|nr:efflux RND transporter permease subunit [Pseudomonas gingeri]NWB26758.1 efflux RND transporter permease subunit [Pseudomonas gingeri]NWC32692.1 efflux RND transporter permease subunit [Pseudomonas gingeri]NWD07136.1 efflux RND transporter permease subunit [Pseudomonas gingeri]NWD51297.1 efflux RND transporter permease subunit [Pseudomonas gingeri]NWE31735.1 efflux RND transporter permease subunit [Pseudomonas gingeri]